MEKIIADLSLDTYRRNKIQPLVIPQHDYGARYIRARITEQGKSVSVASGSVVSIIAKRMADGQSSAFSGSVNTDGSVLVPITQWMLDAPSDDVDCHVAVTGNGYQYSTTSFVISPQERENPSDLGQDDPRVNIVEEALITVVEGADRAEKAADRAKADADRAASYGAKSAYGYAQDGGYTGTEEEFAEDINPDNINANAQNFIATELAKRGQLKPEFANSVEECTDTSKLYVLPDGMIYGYVKTETTRPAYTNVYNKAAAQKGYRLGSGGEVSAYEDCFVTNFIPVSPGTQYTVRLLGAGNFEDGNDRLSEYSEASGTSHVLQTRGSALTTTAEASGAIVFTFTTQSTSKYIRLSLQYDNANFDSYVITLNQPLEEETIVGYQWASTGHAFVPADYEDRIIALEEATAGIGNVDGAPTYIVEEAKRVATLVASKKTVNSFSFIAASDTHHSTGTNTPASVIHAGMGAEYVRRFTQVDMFTMLGDYIGGSDGDTKEGATNEYFAIHKAMYSAGNGVKQIWLRGNHDRLLQSGGTTATDEEFSLDEMYAHIGSMNADTVSADGSGSYGYMDFEQKKLRVVYLNTSDDDVTYVWCTPAQIQWIADNALNLSSKANPSEWGIIVLSHVPIWGGVFDYMTAIQTMFDAYNGGRNGSVTIGTTAVNYNFATHGEIICFVNGHTHNFATAITPNGIPCFSVPQVCAARYNEYATATDVFSAWGDFDESGNPVYYEKTANTAEGTSFNVFTVDRKNRKIYAHIFGAGTDREISY